MNKGASDSSDEPGGRHSEVGSYDEIYFRKQWLLSLIVLGVLFLVTVLSSAIAFVQGVFIRQVINTTVAIVVLICIVVSYKQPAKVVWSAYVAIVFLHIIGTSGFVSNGGISTYAASLLPIIPIITTLLLGKRVALISLGYVLFVGLVSGVLTIQGKHPSNMTILEHQPGFAMYLTAVAVISGFIAIYSLITTTQFLNADVRDYASKLEEEGLARQSAEERAKEASLAKTQFLATISHELRTPLNSIIGFTQQLKKLELTERGHGCADQITASSKDLLRKVTDLLEYTEIFSNKSSVNMAPCVIEDLFLSLEEFYADVKNNNVITFDYLSLNDRVLVTDIEKIKKSLMNIIDNALEYTQNGEVVVTSKIQSIDNECFFFCNVKDTGVGIDESEIDTLFDVFTQSDMSLSRHHEGVGLGLASSYSLISLLSGTLSVKNNRGDGCTFYLRIPISLDTEVL